MATAQILVLGAGFGGLELSTTLSEELGDRVDVTLIDASDAFVFGYAKLDVMFGRTTLDAVRLPYSAIAKPGVRFVQERFTAIDPGQKSATTESGTYDADYLVVALGADYDIDHTPGLAEANEFYSVAGAARLAAVLLEFTGGRVVVGVCDAPFKCPPAPSECALLVDDFLVERGIRDECEIVLTMPFGTPVPPSPDTSAALLEAFEERGITFVPGKRVTAVEQDRVLLDDGSSEAYDLFLGVPKHRAPDVVEESGMTENGYIPASRMLETAYPGVYAVGDVASVGVPKAGLFAERQASVVARTLIAEITAGGVVEPYDGTGSCYIEFGAGRIGRVDVDFFSGPKPRGTLQAPSAELVAQKEHFGSSRRYRWFGQ